MTTPTNDQESLFKFPCKYPIKIVAKKASDATRAEFETEITKIFRKHFADFSESELSLRESKEGNYLSMTVTVMAQNKEQLDTVYQELTEHHLTVWVL